MPMARLSALGHQKLQNLAARRGMSQQQVLEEALELLDRKQFFEEAHREYQELRDNPKDFADFEQERDVMDGVLDDGAER
jgi:hypothetical protein